MGFICILKIIILNYVSKKEVGISYSFQSDLGNATSMRLRKKKIGKQDPL